MVSSGEMKQVQEKIKKVKSLVKIVKAKGADTAEIEKKIETSTVCMMRDDLEKATKLSDEALEEVNALKSGIDTHQKGQKKGLGRGLGALLGKEEPQSPPKKEEKEPEPAKEEEKKEDPNAQRKEEIKLIIDDWKSQGFNISSIEKDFNKDIAKLEESFIIFSEKITKLEDLKEEFEKIKKDNKDVLEQVQNSVDEIEKSLMEPEMADAVASLIKDLPAMLEAAKKVQQAHEASNQRIEEIKLIIDDWKKEGYDVSALEKVLTEPLEVVETSFIDVADKIQGLMDIEEDFDKLVKDNEAAMLLLGSHTGQIKNMLKDIEKKDEAELQFKALRDFVKKNKDLGDIQKKIAELEGKNIDVAELKKEFENPVTKIDVSGIKKKVDDYQGNTTKQDEILAFLKELPAMIPAELQNDKELTSIRDELLGLEPDAKNLEAVGRIYDNFSKLRKDIQVQINEKAMDIKAQQELRDQKLGGINEQIKAWERDNYQIAKLKDDIASGAPTEDIEKTFNEYKQKIDTLVFQNGIFQKLLTPENLVDFKGEIDNIKVDILNPEKADEVTQKIIKLQYSAKQKEKEREGAAKEGERRDYIQRMLDGYKKEGYVLTQLEEAMGKDLDTMESVFNDVKTRIQRIDAIKVELSNIDIRGLENIAAPIFDLFKDPYQLDQIETLVNRLKETVEKKNARRDDIKAVIGGWKAAGYDTTAIENALSTDIETLEVRFNEFSEKIGKLEGLKEEIGALNTNGFEKKVRVIQDKMSNPENLEAVIEDMDFLRREIEKAAAEAGAVQAEQAEVYIKTVQAWKDAGYQVDDLLARVSSGPIDQTLIDEVKNTDILVDRAEKLRDELKAVKQEWVKEDVDLITDNLYDLGMIGDLEKGFDEIKAKVVEYEKSIGTYQTKINKFKEEGYITTRLEALQGRPDEEIAQEFIKFENDIKLLNQLREALVSLQNRDHPAEYNEVFTELFIKLADPDRINEIGQNLAELESQLDQLDAAAVEDETPVGTPVGEEVSAEDISKEVSELAKDVPKAKVKKKKKSLKKKKKPKAVDKEGQLKEFMDGAREASKDKDYRTAIDYYRKMLAIDPANKQADFLLKRAQAMLRSQGPGEAKTVKKKGKKMKKSKKADDGTEDAEDDGGEPEGGDDAPAGDAGGGGDDGKPTCTSCGGKGECYWCNGSGKCDSCGGEGKNLMGNECVSCKGTGKCPNCDGSAKCYWCGGTGKA